MLSLLRQPKWIIFTLLVPVGMALCLLAANWQYSRHVHRSALNAQIEGAKNTPADALTALAAPGAGYDSADDFRPVTVTGVFEGSGVLVRKRVVESQTGFWVVDPLRTPDGTIVQVLRGWVPTGESARTSPVVPPPPSGDVTVTGWLQASQQAPAVEPTDLPAGQVSALDTAVLAHGAPTFAPYIVASAMTPADSAGLKTIAVPSPGLGPHLAYSWQWCFFALMLPIGWVILARRDLQARRAESASPMSQT